MLTCYCCAEFSYITLFKTESLTLNSYDVNIDCQELRLSLVLSVLLGLFGAKKKSTVFLGWAQKYHCLYLLLTAKSGRLKMGKNTQFKK